MVTGNEHPGGASQVAETLGRMMGLPSPEKVLGELQRLNNNLELMQPDIHKLAVFLSGSGAHDLQNLTAALNQIKSGDLMRLLGDFNQLGKKIYEKLWGKQ